MNLPIASHLIFLPEVLLQTLAFSWLVVFREHHRVTRLTVHLVVVFALIILMVAAELLQALLTARHS